jgi:hypothetical protein
MLLRVGQDLTKLLTPDPAFGASVSQGGATGKDRNRPSADDWAALSSVNRSTTSAPSSSMRSSNHRLAKESAIGLRSNEEAMHRQPGMPDTIRNPQGTARLIGISSSSQFENDSQYEQDQNTVSTGNDTHTTEQDQIKDMITQRERHFFNEISKNPQLRDQHPLMHLISAQQKLLMVDEQSGVLGSKATNGQEGVFGSRYGKQGADSHRKYGAYRLEQPYVNNGKVTLPSVEKKMRKEQSTLAKEKKRNQKLMRKESIERSFSEANLEEDASVSSNSTQGTNANTTVTNNTVAARKHHGFLSQTLTKIEQEMSNT